LGSVLRRQEISKIAAVPPISATGYALNANIFASVSERSTGRQEKAIEEMLSCGRLDGDSVRPTATGHLFTLRYCTRLAGSGSMPSMKYWEIVADKLSAAGFSGGYCSAVTPDGWRWIVDACADDGRRSKKATSEWKKTRDRAIPNSESPSDSYKL
jgi:hypothetical protein